MGIFDNKLKLGVLTLLGVWDSVTFDDNCYKAWVNLKLDSIILCDTPLNKSCIDFLEM